MIRHIRIEESGGSSWEGDLCRIRHFRRSDAMAFYEFAKLPEVSHFMSWEAHTSFEVTKRYLDSVCRKKGKVETPWAIVTKENDHCCGFVSFCNYTPEHRRADFAIALSPSVFGRGIAQEASRFLLVQAKKIGLVRVQAIVEAGNIASQKMMDRLGARHEGVLKDYLQSKSGLVDAHIYAFLIPS